MQDAVNSFLPAILRENKLPYAMNQVKMSIRIISEAELLEKQINYLFEVSFTKDQMILNAAITPANFQLLYHYFDKIYLKAVLTHEVYHYFEEKTTPDGWYVRSTPIFSDQKLHMLYSFIFEELRDHVVNNLMPKKMRDYYLDFKLLSYLVGMGSNGKQVLDRIKVLKNDISRPVTIQTKIFFAPCLAAFVFCGTLGTAAGRSILETFASHYPSEFSVQVEKVRAIFARIKQNPAFPADLSELGLDVIVPRLADMELTEATVYVTLKLEPDRYVNLLK